MKNQDKHRQEGHESTSQASPAADTEKAVAKPDTSKPGLKFVFKIAPADPKRNSIDFEDVADK